MCVCSSSVAIMTPTGVWLVAAAAAAALLAAAPMASASAASAEPCPAESLQRRLLRSQSALTATVRAVLVDDDDAEGVAAPLLLVRVGRVLRGDRRLEQRSALVAGVADRRLCPSGRVRVRDTRIFLVHHDADADAGDADAWPRLRLTSSLVPVTLANLQTIRAAVQQGSRRKTNKKKSSPTLPNLLPAVGRDPLVARAVRVWGS